MPQETAKPFSKEPPRSSDDPALVEHVLGSREADDMRSLLDGSASNEEPATQSGTGLTVSANEQTMVAEVEAKTSKEQSRREFSVWAESIGMSEKLIETTFVFNPDGTVVVESDLRILYNDLLTELPPGLVEVNGSVELPYNKLGSLKNFPRKVDGQIIINKNQLTSLEGLPDEINGDLDISFNPITSLEHISKKINGNVFLDNIQATSIPRGLEINGAIFLSSEQEELKKDAILKGYEVDVDDR